MDSFNWPVILGASLIPLLFGGIWYSKAIYESITGDKSTNRKHGTWIYILCYLMGIPIAYTLNAFYLAHEVHEQIWTHGAIHGTLLGLFVSTPVLAVHFAFEGDRSMRNSLYHIVYWIISIGLIGAVVFAGV